MAGVRRELFITTVLPSTAVFFHGTYRGAKSVVPRNTTLSEPISGIWGQSPERGPGQSPGQGVRGKAPLKQKDIYFFDAQRMAECGPLSRI